MVWSPSNTDRGYGDPVTNVRSTIVGVDGSDAATAAVRWAALRAAGTGAELRLVHAYAVPVVMPVAPFMISPATQQAYEQAGQAVLDQAAEIVRAVADDVRVTTALVPGGPAYALIEESERADLVVVGSRGHGGFADVLLGSVGVQVSAHARCPTVVVRGHQRAGGPIVVGVDGSPASGAALRFGFAEALRRRLPVLAVCAWAAPLPTGIGEALAAALADGHSPAEHAAAARAVLSDAIRPLKAEFAGVEVHEAVVEQTPAAALVEASQAATMVAIGSRGHGGFAGLLLGSTSQHVLHHAGCPVVLTRVPEPAGS